MISWSFEQFISWNIGVLEFWLFLFGLIGGLRWASWWACKKIWICVLRQRLIIYVLHFWIKALQLFELIRVETLSHSTNTRNRSHLFEFADIGLGILYSLLVLGELAFKIIHLFGFFGRVSFAFFRSVVSLFVSLRLVLALFLLRKRLAFFDFCIVGQQLVSMRPKI